MRTLLAVFVVATLIGCTGQPQPPAPVSDTNPNSNLIVMPDGEVLPFPAFEPVPNSDEIEIATATDPGCASSSGPVRRVYTPSNLSINYINATITLPAPSSILNTSANNTPFVYAGGWSDSNKALDAGLQYSPTNGNWSPFFAVEDSQAAPPQGQPKPSTTYVPPASTNPIGIPIQNDNSTRLRLDGGQSFNFSMWTTDTEIVMKIAPISAPGTLTWRPISGGAAITDGQPRYFKYAVGVLNSPKPTTPPTPASSASATPSSIGWTTAGTGQILKAMTTVAQPVAPTNPNGNTSFLGTRWAATNFGTRDASGAVTTKISAAVNPTLIPNSKRCNYPSGTVSASGDLLSTTGESVSITYVGPSVASITPTTFTFRGKPGDVFNSNVNIKNTGPVGSLLYWCKRNASNVCSPTLLQKYTSTSNSKNQILPGINGSSTQTTAVTNSAGVVPKCPTDPSLAAQTGSFSVEYQTSTTTGVTTINYTLKCVAMTFAWFDDPSVSLAPNVFNGPLDLCRPMVAVVNVKSNLPSLSSADLTVKVDTTVIPSNQLSFFSGPNANDITVYTNNHCNYSVGAHTLSVTLNDPDASGVALASVSGSFTIEDNRWTLALVNATNNCSGIPGAVISTNTSTPGETNQVSTNIAVGAAVPAFLSAGKPYSIDISSTGGIGGTYSLNFPASFGATLPLNIGFTNYSGVNAHAAFGIQRGSCAGGRSSTPFVLVPMISDTPWPQGDQRLRLMPKR